MSIRISKLVFVGVHTLHKYIYENLTLKDFGVGEPLLEKSSENLQKSSCRVLVLTVLFFPLLECFRGPLRRDEGSVTASGGEACKGGGEMSWTDDSATGSKRRHSRQQIKYQGKIRTSRHTTGNMLYSLQPCFTQSFSISYNLKQQKYNKFIA